MSPEELGGPRGLAIIPFLYLDGPVRTHAYVPIDA
jgi:hypothetical protein